MLGQMITYALAKAILEERQRDAERHRLAGRARRHHPATRTRLASDHGARSHLAKHTSSPRRLTLVLFAGAALGATAHIAAGTISILAVVEVTGSATLAGLPVAVGVLGTATGSMVLPRLFVRRGLRRGLIIGYVAAAVGNLICLISLGLLSLPLLLIGMALSGVGTATNHLTRYVAAESYPTERRARVVGMIVWAGTLGSFVGPLLLAPSASLAVQFGRSQLTGGFLVAAAFTAAVAVLYLATLRGSIAALSLPHAAAAPPGILRGIIAHPSARVALTALVGSQLVMVIIMGAAPLHVTHHSSALADVGSVMMAHTVGMFALAPLIGRLADRHGATLTLIIGLTVLGISAAATAVFSVTATIPLAVVLFGLGLGWSLAFVAGSSILAKQGGLGAGFSGRADAFVWLSGGAASISSGAIYSASDFRTVAFVALLITAGVTILTAWGWRFTDGSPLAKNSEVLA